VLSTYKGQAASEIDLLYDNTFGAVNGPINFSLKEGHRYRFYLNPGPRGAFITALDANIDNRWAVESLDADEPDSSPPLLMKEAQNLADAYFRKFRSDSNDVQSDRYDPYYYVFKNQNQAGLMPNVWYFNYSYFPTPMNKRQFLADAQIYVRGDRTIDPMTWIAARPAMKPGEILTADIGKEVRLDVAQVRNRFVRGLLESITDQKIRLKDPHNESDDSIADAGYFKHDLNTIWILEPTSK
jgi:hypothetical protein